MSRRLTQRSALLVVALTALAAAWLYLAPPLLGGKTSYAIVDGVSMQPRFHGGDLVLLRARSTYHRGEIVGYRSSLLRNLVMHRIVAVDGGRYVFRGDNNNFVDSVRPRAGDLVGEEWLRVPWAGRAAVWLREPAHLPLAAALLVLLLLGGRARSPRRRRGSAPPVPAEQPESLRLRPVSPAPTPAPRPSPARPEARPASSGLLPAGALALAVTLTAIGAAFVAVRAHAGMGFAESRQPYTVSGTFTYSGRAARSAVYPSGRAVTGDPLFLNVVRRARVALAFRLAAPLPADVTGSASMLAVLESPQGWHRVLRLSPPQPFTGAQGVVAGTLPLAQIRQLVAEYQHLTGVAQSTYTLTVAPTVALHGRIGGAHFATTFAPRLPLAVDPYEIQVTQPQTVGSGDASPPDPLHASSGGGVLTPKAARLELPGVSADPATAGRAAVVLAALLFLLATIGWLRFERIRYALARDEVLRIDSSYGDWIVPVAVSAPARSAAVVDVGSIDQLVRVAERYERMILRERAGERVSYLVDDGATVYRYAVGGASDDDAPSVSEHGATAPPPLLRTLAP